MTRKDYELIASAIAEQAALYHPGPTQSSLAKAAVQATAERIATVLARDNDRFNRALFIAACGFPLPLSR